MAWPPAWLPATRKRQRPSAAVGAAWFIVTCMVVLGFTPRWEDVSTGVAPQCCHERTWLLGERVSEDTRPGGGGRHQDGGDRRARNGEARWSCAYTPAEYILLLAGKLSAGGMYAVLACVVLSRLAVVHIVIERTILYEFATFRSFIRSHARQGALFFVMLAVHVTSHVARLARQHILADAVGDTMGWTGLVALILMLGTLPLSQSLRRRFLACRLSYEMRLVLHGLWVVAAAVLVGHKRRFGLFFVSLVFLYMISKIVDVCLLTVRVDRADLICCSRGCLVRWLHHPTMHDINNNLILLAIPAVSKTQFHPMGTFRDPYNPLYSCSYVHAAGDWTDAVHQLSKSETVCPLYVRGPMGSEHRTSYDDKHVLIIGSGVALTPLLGLTQSFDATRQTRRLIWILRDADVMGTLLPVMSDQLSVHVYYTGRGDLLEKISADDQYLRFPTMHLADDVETSLNASVSELVRLMHMEAAVSRSHGFSPRARRRNSLNGDSGRPSMPRTPSLHDREATPQARKTDDGVLVDAAADTALLSLMTTARIHTAHRVEHEHAGVVDGKMRLPLGGGTGSAARAQSQPVYKDAATHAAAAEQSVKGGTPTRPMDSDAELATASAPADPPDGGELASPGASAEAEAVEDAVRRRAPRRRKKSLAEVANAEGGAPSMLHNVAVHTGRPSSIHKLVADWIADVGLDDPAQGCIAVSVSHAGLLEAIQKAAVAHGVALTVTEPVRTRRNQRPTKFRFR